MTKEELIKFLDGFKIHTKIMNKEIYDIKLFSGIKPSGYCVPRILDYLNHPPYSENEPNNQIQLSWFVEIWINELCVWRKEHAFNSDEEPTDKYEQELIDRIVEEMLMHGLFESWNVIKKLHK